MTELDFPRDRPAVTRVTIIGAQDLAPFLRFSPHRPLKPRLESGQLLFGLWLPIKNWPPLRPLPKLLAWFQTPHTVSRPSRPNFQPHRTVEHTSQKLVSLQPPFTLKPRPKGAKKISGLVPDTSYRFQTVQTQFPASQNC